MRRLFILAVVVAAFAGLAIFTDPTDALLALAHMPRTSLLALVLLFLIASLVKGLRWAYYLRAARLDIRWRDGVTSYLGSMATAPLPGGSWLSVRLVKEHGVPVRRAAAAFFVNYVGDAIAITMVAFVVLVYTAQPGYRFIFPIVGALLAALTVTMGRSEAVWCWVSKLSARFRLTRNWLPQEDDVHQRIRILMRLPVMAGGVLFSITTTFLTAAFLFVLFDALTFRGMTFIEGLFVLSASESAAVAIPVPGGFGVMDSSIVSLMTGLGVGLWRATFLAVMFRSVDLVFKMLLGTLVLVVCYGHMLFAGFGNHRHTRRAYRRARSTWGLRHIVPQIRSMQTRTRESTAGLNVSDSGVGHD